MRSYKGSIKKMSVPLLWLSTGFLSWCLTIYLFHFLISPLFIESIRIVNAGDQSLFVKNVANMLFAHMAAYLLCFLFSFVLGLYTETTRFRLALFVIGAIGVSLYLQGDSVMAYWRQYSEIPSWAATSVLQGLASSLLIVPLLSWAGSKAGALLSTRRQK